MPTLIIDGKKVTVPEGATILDAARAAGIGDAERAAWLFDAACDADAGLSPGQFHKPVSGGVSGGGGGMSCDGDG